MKITTTEKVDRPHTKQNYGIEPLKLDPYVPGHMKVPKCC